MKIAALSLVLAALAFPATAQMTSEYTRYDIETDCAMIARAPDDEGDWADFVCTGFAGYPFVIRYSDGRESVTYGFATESGMATFGPFNYANEVVEWRVSTDRDTARPVAAIQRWFLADGEGNWAHQILVVSRVGQPSGGGACAIAFLSAADGAPANERARVLADNGEGFACDSDTPIVDASIGDLVGIPQ